MAEAISRVFRHPTRQCFRWQSGIFESGFNAKIVWNCWLCDTLSVLLIKKDKLLFFLMLIRIPLIYIFWSFQECLGQVVDSWSQVRTSLWSLWLCKELTFSYANPSHCNCLIIWLILWRWLKFHPGGKIFLNTAKRGRKVRFPHWID